MSKYVIEFDKEQLLEYDKDTDTYFRTLYKAKGFNTLVFDQFGLDKLTPLDKALSSELGEAYHKGFEAGQHEATTLEYQQGLDDAWECARKIVVEQGSGGYTYEHLEEVLGTRNIHKILCNMTPSEVIDRIKAYEEQQKADAEIKVGDEVIPIDAIRRPFVVVSIENNVIHGFELTDGYTPRGCHRDETRWEKTGRHFPQVAELLKAMKGGTE